LRLTDTGSGALAVRDSDGTRHRLLFLNRALFGGVPIPPLEVEIRA